MQGNLTTPIPARKAQLLKRLGELGARLEAIEVELDSHQNRDWEELATEREGDEVLADLGQSARNELRMIEAAFTRIGDGEYGYCVTCGDEIAEDRLDLIPATPFCAKHAR